MQAITWTLCNDKVGIGKYGTLAPIHKRFEKGLCFANNVEYELRFCPNDIKCCVSGKKKKYVLNCVELVEIGTNLLRKEVLALKDATLQHSPIVVRFQQSQPSPSLGHISVPRKT